MIYVSRLPKMFRIAAYVAAFLTGLAAALFLGGCGAAPDSAILETAADRSLNIDRPLELDALEGDLPPIWEGDPEFSFDFSSELDAPAHQYFGGSAPKNYGVTYGDPKQTYLQDGGETTWAFSADSEPTRFQASAARAAFEYYGHILPNWTFVELPASNGRTDIVIRLGDGDPAPGCLDHLASGSCWFASASCKHLSETSTGLADYHVCEQFHVNFGVRAVEGFAEAEGISLLEAYEVVLIHEIGHTLGLDHAPKDSASIMRPSAPFVGYRGRTERATLTDCEVALLRGYDPHPAAWAPLQIAPSPEACSR